MNSKPRAPTLLFTHSTIPSFRLQSLRSYCADNNCSLDDGVLADSESGNSCQRLTAPKPKQPRRKKVEERVDLVARMDAAAGLGLPPPEDISSRGRPRKAKRQFDC